jgi:hypothetical protein
MPGCPNHWTINALKIACLLRVCDACHLDARRAPAFLMALRKPTGRSELHWRFQGYLQQPTVKHNRVQFTTTKAIPIEDREAWWFGYELLCQADRELNDVDSVLREEGIPPLTAHGVAGVESPERLASFLKTAGWSPVDASVRITDVGKMVATLGGEHLYGSNPTVPLRELIQNARDAVVARRVLEKREGDWGRIWVRLFERDNRHWLEIEDTGLGMSSEVMSGPLLDFGRSYWESDLAIREWPSLLSSEFEPTGKYGIGFFSVFMVADQVEVVSRRAEDGKSDTRVLEFPDGFSAHPLLRPAVASEQRNEAGTAVRLRLRRKPRERGGVLGPLRHSECRSEIVSRTNPWSLRELCEWLCPALDVTLMTSDGSHQCVAVQASDWTTIKADVLLRRTILNEDDRESILHAPVMQSLISHVRQILDPSGRVIARGFLWPDINFYAPRKPRSSEGLITAGGFRGRRAPNLFGLWLGHATSANRYEASPMAADHPSQLMQWATGQAQLLAGMGLDLSLEVEAAMKVRCIGADTGSLPIALTHAGLASFHDLCARTDLPDEVVLFPTAPWDSTWFDHALVPYDKQTSHSSRTRTTRRLNRHALPDAIGVLCPRMRGWLLPTGWYHDEDPMRRAKHPAWRRFWMSLWGATMEAVARAWSVSLDSMLACSDISTKRSWYIAPVGAFADGRAIQSCEVDILRKPRDG